VNFERGFIVGREGSRLPPSRAFYSFRPLLLTATQTKRSRLTAIPVKALTDEEYLEM
jgi:hypothetical protein